MAGHVRNAASAITAAHRQEADDRFTVTLREPVPGVRVVTAAGEATITNSPVLDAALRAQVAAAPDHLVVDLTGVRFLNYHTAVSLVSVHRAASRAGIAFHLIGTDTPGSTDHCGSPACWAPGQTTAGRRWPMSSQMSTPVRTRPGRRERPPAGRRDGRGAGRRRHTTRRGCHGT